MKKRKQKHKKITGKMKAEYYRYLKSAQWKEKRKMALAIYGGSCGMCGSRHDLEVHHRHYKNIFHERIEDLMILCEPCHKLYHKKQIWKNGKKSKYMRDPNYQVQTTTFYPDRRLNNSV